MPSGGFFRGYIYEEALVMKLVSVINYKGGVGKTTLAANLGAYAASKGRRVLMVDLDPQTQLTFSFMMPEEWREKYSADKTFKNYFKAVTDGDFAVPSLRRYLIPLNSWDVLKLGDEKFDLISSHLDLIDLDIKLANMIIVGNEAQLASSSLRTYSHLKRSLAELQEDYDIAIIDCPPTFNILVKNAIFASDYYIIPAKLDYLSMLGIANLERNVNFFRIDCQKFMDIKMDMNYAPLKLSLLGIVPMMVNIAKGDEPIAVQQEYMKAMKDEGYYMFRYVRNNGSVFGGAPREGVPAVLTRPKFNLSAKRIVRELQELGEEFLRKIDA